MEKEFIIPENVEEPVELGSLLTELAEIDICEYIFFSPTCSPDNILTVLVTGSCDTIGQGTISLVKEIVKSYPAYEARTYTTSYAAAELKEGNLYFIRNCMLGHPVYQKDDHFSNIFRAGTKSEYLLLTSENWFHNEQEKIKAFKVGSLFYKNNKTLNLATFLLHQSIELNFRCLERFAMGRSRVSHRISEHREYLRSFGCFADQLFEEKEETDQYLLELLDRSYSETRYKNDFEITKQELKLLLKKAEALEAEVQEVYLSKLDDCYKILRRRALEEKAISESNLSILDPENLHDEKLRGLINILSLEFKIIKIFCLSMRKGECSREILIPGTALEEVRHYDLFIITEESVNVHPNRLSELVHEKSKQQVTTTLVLYDLSKFRLELSKKDRFIHLLLQKCEGVYEDATFKMPPQDHSPGQIDEYDRAKTKWHVRISRANDYLKASESIVGQDEDAEFSLMYLALQQICLGILYVQWGYQPNHLNLGYLFELCNSFTPIPKNIFPRDSTEEKRLYKKILSSMHDTQFRTQQNRSRTEVDTLLYKCTSFKEEMENLAADQLKVLAQNNLYEKNSMS